MPLALPWILKPSHLASLPSSHLRPVQHYRNKSREFKLFTCPIYTMKGRTPISATLTYTVALGLLEEITFPLLSFPPRPHIFCT